MGNYKSFGDQKFIVRIFRSRKLFNQLTRLLIASLAKRKIHQLDQLFGIEGNYRSIQQVSLFENSISDVPLLTNTRCVDKMYSLAENEKEMGLDGQGVSSFYSEGITRAEIQVVQDWMSANKIEGYNTRLFKVADKGIIRTNAIFNYVLL
jgi:hypothetical protein